MQKERAASAFKHGLPVPIPEPRARTLLTPSSPSPARSSSLPPGSRRMPIAVKLLLLGLGILGSIYGMTLLRDRSSGPQAIPGSKTEAGVIAPTAPAKPTP